MGRVILCVGKEAKQPYLLRSVDMEVSSMEELCYAFYHNAFVMQDELFSPQLIRFIGEELGLSERAEYLQRLCESHAGAKDILVAIFCSTDYFSEEEIKSFLRRYDAFYEMSPMERKKWSADRMMKEGKERDAAQIYADLLKTEGIAMLTEKEHGNLLHNLAVAEMHLGSLNTAPGHFREAYELNHSEDSLRQYLIALKLTGQEELFDRELKLVSPRREVLDRMTQELYMARSAAEQTADFQAVDKLRELHENGQILEYYQHADALLEKLKQDYRLQDGSGV